MPPEDVTLGELWRLHMDQKALLTNLIEEVRALPARLQAEMHLVQAELHSLVEERMRAHEREYSLRIGNLQERLDVLWKAGLGIVAFVFVAVGGALIALVINR